MKDILLVKDQLKVKVGGRVIKLDEWDCDKALKNIIKASLEAWIFEVRVSVYSDKNMKQITVYLRGDANRYKEFTLYLEPSKCKNYDLENVVNKIITFTKEIEKWVNEVRKNREIIDFKFPLYNDKFDLKVELTLYYEKYNHDVDYSKVYRYDVRVKINGQRIPDYSKLIIKEALRDVEFYKGYKVKYYDLCYGEICPRIITPDGEEKEFIGGLDSTYFSPKETWNIRDYRKEAYRYFHDVSRCIERILTWIEFKEEMKRKKNKE